MSHQNVTFPSGDRSAHGYLALPVSGSGPGVIVIQEWWGLTDHIKSVADRLAAEGFVALAPDLYGGKTTHDADEAAKMMEQLPESQAVRDLSGAVEYLLAHEAVTGDAVGAMGFCMGGGFVVHLAAVAGAKVGAAVPFYGVLQSQPDLSGIEAPVLGHYAETDDFAPADKALAMGAAIREAGGEAAIHIYGGNSHAFFNDTNPFGTYSEADAAIAWQRSLSFLRSQLS